MTSLRVYREKQQQQDSSRYFAVELLFEKDSYPDPDDIEKLGCTVGEGGKSGACRDEAIGVIGESEGSCCGWSLGKK